ncbi:MAG: glycosyltransferase family 4 protein [Phycisphaerae bacterium]
MPDAAGPANARTDRVFLVISQTYVPDPAAVGQHMHDLAVAMARRGWRTIVLCSGRGYDDPTARYLPFEIRDGVEIRRIPFASFGKKTIAHRVTGTASFMSQALARAVAVPDVAGMLFSTSPPMIGGISTLVKRFREVPAAYWAMDLNPDQLIAMGKLRPDQAVTRLLEKSNRLILKNADYVVALDRFMAGRLQARVDLGERMDVIPPWSHEAGVDAVAHEDNWFRTKHNLQGKFVVMYSGNHSPANPLDTLLAAAERTKDDPNLVYAFIGGGAAKKDVEAFVKSRGLSNCLLLPYQPMQDLPFSLSAADVHVVTLGQEMVGIVHPCKVYGAMAVGRPVLFCGPRPSHVSDLLDKHDFGWSFEHGEVDKAVETLRATRQTPPTKLAAMGQTARSVLAENLGQQRLVGRMCDRLEAMMGARQVSADPFTT